jgi:preprotein translocase subunit SecA
MGPAAYLSMVPAEVSGPISDQVGRMFSAIARQLLGSANDRILRRMAKSVEQINSLEPELEKLSDEELRGRTDWLRKRYGEGEPLDSLLTDAFATVREAAKRTLRQRHYDVQLTGGMVLHEGMIAEMKTGEGKTLVATLPVYLNALTGKGVHVVTVNDYLARRDAEWMGQIYKFLGLSVGTIVHGLDDAERKAAYDADITYGTNNEFGFDYLRDNMKMRFEDMVQREFHYAIVDEVDNIFIDEARTPLIISGPAEDATDLYRRIDALMPKLSKEHYEKDEKHRTASLTEAGQERIQELLTEAKILDGTPLYDLSNISVVHHVNQALRAHTLFERDRDYIVKDGRVIIIDEFTGRMMEGRRYSDGLHQALEAKENVAIQNENQTLASITFQNYFRLYPKLAGMTGTALTEAAELGEIYKLDVVDLPTNVPCIRQDLDDEVYRTAKEKYDAILTLIEDCQKRNQPVLVGTVSIEKSEHLSGLLKNRGIRHNVLNARYHEQEAFIIAQAGKPGTITIATNMAGRGTDIQLGGNPDMQVRQELAAIADEAERARREPEIRVRVAAEVAAAKKVVIDAGGLYVLGTERHEARRIDNQLRGRSGRQGDPGKSKFFLSLEDDLMRIFGSERIDGMLQRLGIEEGEAIVHRWINKALERAQKKVEERNFEIRKNLLRFDDVMNDQRKQIYQQRKELMQTSDVSATIAGMRHDTIDDLVTRCIPEKAYAEQWDTAALHEEVLRITGLNLPIVDWAKEEGIAEAEIRDRVNDAANKLMAQKVANYSPEVMRLVEKSLLLQILDQTWKEHLLELDHLRQGIGLRAYGQKDPLNEYKREAFALFQHMLERLRETVTTVMCHLELRIEAPPEPGTPAEPPLRPAGPRRMMETRADPAFAQQEMQMAGANGGEPRRPAQPTRMPAAGRQQIDPRDPSTWGKVPRNAACPCGSGKKFKHCHGRMA